MVQRAHGAPLPIRQQHGVLVPIISMSLREFNRGKSHPLGITQSLQLVLQVELEAVVRVEMVCQLPEHLPLLQVKV